MTAQDESLHPRLLRIETKLDARNLVGAYADAVDSRDVTAFDAIFAEDMQLLAPGRHYVGRAAVVEFYRDSAERDPSPRRHFICNTRIVHADIDGAEALSSFVYTAGTAGQSVVGWGRYRDVFARRNGELMFVEKNIEVEFRGPIDVGWAAPGTVV